MYVIPKLGQIVCELNMAESSRMLMRWFGNTNLCEMGTLIDTGVTYLNRSMSSKNWTSLLIKVMCLLVFIKFIGLLIRRVSREYASPTLRGKFVCSSGVKSKTRVAYNPELQISESSTTLDLDHVNLL